MTKAEVFEFYQSLRNVRKICGAFAVAVVLACVATFYIEKTVHANILGVALTLFAGIAGILMGWKDKAIPTAKKAGPDDLKVALKLKKRDADIFALMLFAVGVPAYISHVYASQAPLTKTEIVSTALAIALGAMATYSALLKVRVSFADHIQERDALTAKRDEAKKAALLKERIKRDESLKAEEEANKPTPRKPPRKRPGTPARKLRR